MSSWSPAWTGSRCSATGRLVADHDRCWARHQSLHDPAHVDAARVLRTEHATRPRPAEPEVELRCLADYDTALGLDNGLDDDLDGGIDGRVA